ncbi:hypothetical protein K1719_016663 [Acacia pycnantha]|nr:hypothetical protein K1719_016663 [Acacia pycnantha]
MCTVDIPPPFPLPHYKIGSPPTSSFAEAAARAAVDVAGTVVAEAAAIAAVDMAFASPRTSPTRLMKPLRKAASADLTAHATPASASEGKKMQTRSRDGFL